MQSDFYNVMGYKKNDKLNGVKCSDISWIYLKDDYPINKKG